jgi:hypothetical protein
LQNSASLGVTFCPHITLIEQGENLMIPMSFPGIFDVPGKTVSAARNAIASNLRANL